MIKVLFLIELSNQKTLFLDFFFFVSDLQLEVFFIPMCGIQFSYHVVHTLIFHMRCGTEIFCQIFLVSFKICLVNRVKKT